MKKYAAAMAILIAVILVGIASGADVNLPENPEQAANIVNSLFNIVIIVFGAGATFYIRRMLDVIKVLSNLCMDTAEVGKAITDAYANDQVIDPTEAKDIAEHYTKLQTDLVAALQRLPWGTNKLVVKSPIAKK
jgi:hypothetical protein